MLNYKGIIIEESLENKSVLGEVTILDMKIEKVKEGHKTPWLKQWTLHTVEVSEEKAAVVARQVQSALDTKHTGSWYADFGNDKFYFIIFRDKIFRANRGNEKEHDEIVRYGLTLGIPKHQLDFTL